MIEKRCFTIEILGGGPFELSVPLNPILQYEGTRTLWKVIVTEEQIPEIVSFIRGEGCSVKVYTEYGPGPLK